MTNTNKILILLILIAIAFRIPQLSRPVWIDEVAFYSYTQHITTSEWVPVIFGKIIDIFFNLRNPIFLRLPFIIAGILCIPAVFYSFHHKCAKIFLGTIFAVSSIYVFWGTMARPYIMAVLFMILGWRNWIFYIPMIFCTPLSLIGLNFYRLKSISVRSNVDHSHKKWFFIYFLLGVMAAIWLVVKPGVNNPGYLSWEFLSHAKRIQLLFYSSVLLHCTQFLTATKLGKRLCMGCKRLVGKVMPIRNK